MKKRIDFNWGHRHDKYKNTERLSQWHLPVRAQRFNSYSVSNFLILFKLKMGGPAKIGKKVCYWADNFFICPFKINGKEYLSS